MDDQDSSGPDGELFGFTRAEWAAADALEYLEADWLDAYIGASSGWPRWMRISGGQWLRLGSLSPSHAARVLHLIGPAWQEWAAARRARIPELADPDLKLDFLEWAKEYEVVLEELRRLAGTESDA